MFEEESCAGVRFSDGHRQWRGGRDFTQKDKTKKIFFPRENNLNPFKNAGLAPCRPFFGGVCVCVPPLFAAERPAPPGQRAGTRRSRSRGEPLTLPPAGAVAGPVTIEVFV